MPVVFLNLIAAKSSVFIQVGTCILRRTSSMKHALKGDAPGNFVR